MPLFFSLPDLGVSEPLSKFLAPDAEICPFCQQSIDSLYSAMNHLKKHEDEVKKMPKPAKKVEIVEDLASLLENLDE